MMPRATIGIRYYAVDVLIPFSGQPSAELTRSITGAGLDLGICAHHFVSKIILKLVQFYNFVVQLADLVATWMQYINLPALKGCSMLIQILFPAHSYPLSFAVCLPFSS
jgi:hypothetical protein